MKKSKKLSLNKETLRTLNAEALQRVVGGKPFSGVDGGGGDGGPGYSGGCLADRITDFPNLQY